MSTRIDTLRPADWDAVLVIYEEGIATGDATGRVSVSSSGGADPS